MLAAPTRDRGPISPSTVDGLDLTVIAALLGIDRDRTQFEDEWNRMRRLRLEAAREGRSITWDDLA